VLRCSGPRATSNGHPFHRLSRATGDEAFLAAARTHFGQALRLRGSGQKLAGYSFWTNVSNSPEPAWGPDASLLSGITGVGLALLSPGNPGAPNWDALLLLNDGGQNGLETAANNSLPGARDYQHAAALHCMASQV